jgi:hypothetical protein
MKLNTPEARDKAWQMVRLMETVGTEVATSEAHDVYQQQDYADKMLVSLLKIELLSTADSFDSGEFYHGRLIVTSSSSN